MINLENLENSTNQKIKDGLLSEFFEKSENCKTIPKGWVSIEEFLPFWLATDFMQGFTTYLVKFNDQTESTSHVSDHLIWYYEAKEAGITHWYNN